MNERSKRSLFFNLQDNLFYLCLKPSVSKTKMTILFLNIFLSSSSSFPSRKSFLTHLPLIYPYVHPPHCTSRVSQCLPYLVLHSHFPSSGHHNVSRDWYPSHPAGLPASPSHTQAPPCSEWVPTVVLHKAEPEGRAWIQACWEEILENRVEEAGKDSGKKEKLSVWSIVSRSLRLPTGIDITRPPGRHPHASSHCASEGWAQAPVVGTESGKDNLGICETFR